MNAWLENPDHWDYAEPFDPLCVERSAPVSDREAAEIEELCQTATPGPMALDDDETTTEGSVVALLPDGRAITTLVSSMAAEEVDLAAEANAQLICKARYYLLRLLRDRQRWMDERRQLLKRIEALEAALGPPQPVGGPRPRPR